MSSRAELNVSNIRNIFYIENPPVVCLWHVCALTVRKKLFKGFFDAIFSNRLEEFGTDYYEEISRHSILSGTLNARGL